MGGNQTWRQVGADLARYEYSLMQLGKVEISSNDLLNLEKRKGRKVIHSPFKVFLYDMEQFKDEENERLFLNELQSFLGLEKEIKDIPKTNHAPMKTYEELREQYPELIDICQPRYESLRLLLTKNGRKTKDWIKNKFMKSKDVTVSGGAHFMNILESWEIDPCIMNKNIDEESSKSIVTTYESENNTGKVDNDVRLDFMVAGFPKCGTSSLLKLFNEHDETLIENKEVCVMNSGKNESIAELFNILEHLPMKPCENTNIKMMRGIKCPSSIRDISGIDKLSNYYTGTKVIIGVRHPILWFESFFNHRVREMHGREDIELMEPPPPESLVGNQTWRQVGADFARYEYSLMQLGKVEISSNDLLNL